VDVDRLRAAGDEDDAEDDDEGEEDDEENDAEEASDFFFLVGVLKALTSASSTPALDSSGLRLLPFNSSTGMEPDDIAERSTISFSASFELLLLELSDARFAAKVFA
jgi:hypothetical protein